MSDRRVMMASMIAIAVLSFMAGIGFRHAWDYRDRVEDLVRRGSRFAYLRAEAVMRTEPGVAVSGPAGGDTLTPSPPAADVAGTPLAAELSEQTNELAFPLVQQQVPTPTWTPTPTETKRPSPTPTPTMPWPDTLEQPGRSKLGLHIQWNNSPEIMEFVRRMKPPVVKAVGDFGFLNEVKEVSPSTVTVARVEVSPRLDGDPVQAAQAFVANHMETYRLNPAVDYWEGVNEPQMGDRMAWFAAFEAERARLMAEHGWRVAVGAFSAGTPEWDEFQAFLPAIAAAKKYGGILTVHEYDAPLMDRSAGAGLPGHPNYPDRGALALRYRWWYEDFLKPRGLVVPLVVSEAGVDGWIGNRPGPKGRGWQDFRDYWGDQGLGRSGIDAYIRQLDWYDNELQRDDYVIGFAVFTAGAMNDDWRSYDVTDYLRHLATYIVAPKAR